ncbi:methyltransferase family protein [Thioclava sp. NG1]|uniref:methyltransferase family protein n=1 Tax=Thioclava sp. NG1 TaxID=2182426 RepID=UPI001E65B3EF|nr:isoprenylcysteine carboxylmethyltransferase family protein [Thioclava sp. NG1]
MNPLREIDIPPLWLVLFAALVWALGRVVPMPFRYDRALGLIAIALGLALMLVAVGQMLLRRTTFIPRRDPSDLVTSGVFALSRNPIYLGDALVLAGLALIWHAPLGLLLVPVFMWFITRRYILGEEARIAAHFGETYTAYRARTRRWL